MRNEKNMAIIEWHPIKKRPLTEEELRDFKDIFGEDDVPGYILEGPLPEDGQMILVTYQMRGEPVVAVDVCIADEMSYYLEDLDDFDRIDAWAAFPKPYKNKTSDRSRILRAVGRYLQTQAEELELKALGVNDTIYGIEDILLELDSIIKEEEGEG